MLDVPIQRAAVAAAGPPIRRRDVSMTAAGAIMAAAPLATILFPLLRSAMDATVTRAALLPTLVLAAVALGTAAGVCGAAVLLVPSLLGGGRRAVMPALTIGAAAGVGAVLVVPAAAELLLPSRATVPVPDGRLTYVAAAAAAAGLAQILAVHRLARVGGQGVALVAGAALVVGAAEALLPVRPTLEDGVVGLAAAAAVMLVGLGRATLVDGPTAGRRPDVAGRRAATLVDGPLAGRRPEVVRPVGTEAADQAAPRPEVVRTVGAAAADQAAVGLVVAATAVGLLARLAVGSSGGTADAAIARLVSGSFDDAIAGSNGAAHPPLAVALVWFSRHLFGGSAAALRLPALVAGLLLVPVAFVTGRALYGKRTGMVAAAVAALGPAFVWVSGSAGPAAVTALLVGLALLGMVAAVRHGHPGGWILFGLAAAAVVWAHQFGMVTVAVLHAAAGGTVLRAFRRRGGTVGPLLGWAVALAVTVTAVAALAGWRDGLGAASTPPTLEYATNAAPAGGHTPFGLAAGGLSTIVGFHPPDVTSRLLALWPLGILGAFVLFGRRWSPRGV
ncbi:MAG: glycosyltransferase family 39 protein, partial [Actinomycetota bacterium]